MQKKIGYFVPEFPGQTHNFFWREICALKVKGVETALLSTRKPPSGLMSTSWGNQAISETSYLFPLSYRDLLGVLGELLRIGPAGWYSCLVSFFRSECDSIRDRIRMIGLIVVAVKLVKLARIQGWDHMHVHSCGNAANIAMFARVMNGPTYGLTLHNPLSVFGCNQHQKWRHASYAILITERLLDHARQELAEDFPDAYAVAPMGVEASTFSRARTYSAYCGSGKFRIFCCARLNRAKGYLELLDSIRMLIDNGLDLTLVIAGEDDQGGRGFRKELEEKILELSLNNHVELIGAQPEEEIQAQLLRAHVFALASYEEPLGVAIMEAMSMEVPVVVTSGGGVLELVRDRVDGLLIPPRNVAAMAAALKEIANKPEQAKEFGVNGRLRILNKFDSNRSADRIASFAENTPS